MKILDRRVIDPVRFWPKFGLFGPSLAHTKGTWAKVLQGLTNCFFRSFLLIVNFLALLAHIFGRTRPKNYFKSSVSKQFLGAGKKHGLKGPNGLNKEMTCKNSWLEVVFLAQEKTVFLHG